MTTAATLATTCAALAALLGAGRPGWAATRLRAVLPGSRGSSLAGAMPRLPPWVRAWAPRAAGVLLAGLLLTGHAEIAVPVAVAAVFVLAPGRRAAVRQAREAARLSRDLPRAADLLAMCLDAGTSPADAVLRVCDVVDGPVRAALLPIGAALRTGVDPAAAWTTGPADDGRGEPVRRLGRAFARAAATGAPLAATVTAVADDERERTRWAAEAAARRAGVRAVGPLALCFLPAFVLLGVVPVVVGVAGEVLGGLR